jgi:hypothetical protein
VTGQGINPGLTAASPQVEPVAVPPSPDDVLWDQPLSSVNQNAYVNQDFGDAYTSFLADDFVNDEPWQIESIFVPGNGWNGYTTIMNATALTWQFYADNGGVPDGDPSGGGNPPVWTLTLPPNDPQVVVTNGSGGLPSNVELILDTPGQLPAGHWWFVFYPTMDFGLGGQYGRQPADTTNGYVGQFINPGGAFGLGTEWQDWTVIGPTQQDIAFRIEGQSAVSYPDFPWISEDPLFGTVAPGECSLVDVTFDSTGMMPGDYLADLLILSNDPDTPEVVVPTTMTVLEPVDGVDFTWEPEVGIEGEPILFTAMEPLAGTPPFTYTWDFGDLGTGMGMTATHIYEMAGVYTVTLWVENACGMAMMEHAVTVEPGIMEIYLPVVLKNS